MKIEYRMRKAERKIRELLSSYDSSMAIEAEKFIGKNFNSATGWEIKGARETMKNVIDILVECNLLYF